MIPIASSRLALLSLAALIAVPARTTSAASLFWDGTDTTADADGGAGVWDLASANWDSLATGGADALWPASGLDNVANFAGAAGIVSIDPAGVAANSLVFTTANYIVAEGPLTLNGATPAVISGVGANISSNLLGTAGLAKLGNGTLQLSGDNSALTGALVISATTAGNDGGVRLLNDTAIGGLSSVTIDNNSHLGLAGVTLGAGVPITVSGGGGTTAPPGAVRNNSGNSVVDGAVAVSSATVRLSNIGGTGSSLTFNGAVTAADPAHGVVVRNADGQGVIFTNPLNSWSGVTDLAQGSVYFFPGAHPATTNTAIGSVLAADLGTNGTFNRSIGSGAGQIRFAKGNDGQRANGFSARGGDLTVNLGGAAADFPFINAFAKTAAVTSGSPTVTVTDATNLVAGMSVTGTGIPGDTLVSSIAGTAVTLNKNATASGAAVALSFYAALDVTRYNSSVLVLNGGNADGVLTFENPLDLNGFGRTVRTDANTAVLPAAIKNLSATAAGATFTGAGTTQVTGVIENGTGVTSIGKTGSGTLILAGSNTFTGGITFNGGGSANSNNIGKLRLTSSTALGLAATSKTINMSTSVGTAIGAIELTNGITVAGKNLQLGGRTNAAANASLRNVSGNNTWSGTITITSPGGSYPVESTAGQMTLGGTISNTVGSSTRGLTFHGDGDTLITGLVQNGSANALTSLIKNGAGTITLRNANTYSGGTTVAAGTLVAQRTTQVALGSGALNVANGAGVSIVDHAGGGQLPYVNNLTLAGSGVSGGGALNFFNSGGFSMTGTVAISGGTSIRTDVNLQTIASTVTFTNVISGTDGLTLFAQNGPAAGTPRFTLTGASTYTGSTVLASSGANTAPFAITLSGGDNRLPVTTDLVFGGTPAGTPAGCFERSVTLVLDGISQEVAGLSNANSPAAAGGYRVTGASASAATLVVNNPGASVFSGVLGGAGTHENNLALTKSGAGTFTLAGSHTYTGRTTITGGTLALDSAYLDDASTLSITSGASVLLTHTSEDVVAALVLNGAQQPDGLYDATTPGGFIAAGSTGSIRVISQGSPFEDFVAAIPNASDRDPSDDPDADGADNLTEFAFNGDPLNGANNGLGTSAVEDLSPPAGRELIFITAVRDGATFAAGVGGEQTATVDGVIYRIQGSLNLSLFQSAISHLGVADTAAGLPSLAGTEWEYHTFKLNASEGLTGEGFIRAMAEELP